MSRHDQDPPAPTQLRRLLRTAREAAALGGAYAVRRHRPAQGIDVQVKAEGDFVTRVDLAVEARLRRVLLGRHPEHGFLGEESSPERLDAPFVWVVDPIDGTSNFARGLRDFAVSVACLHRGRPLAAACFCAPENVLYSAASGLGAFRGRRRLRLHTATLGPAAIVGVQWLRDSRHVPFLEAVLASGSRVRNLGCTVAQLCDVAAGRLDANLQEQGKVWDIAAAGLVVLEAGARFTDWEGYDVFPFEHLDGSRHYPSLAALPAVHRRLVTALR